MNIVASVASRGHPYARRRVLGYGSPQADDGYPQADRRSRELSAEIDNIIEELTPPADWKLRP
jgi:hypothetical protein